MIVFLPSKRPLDFMAAMILNLQEQSSKKVQIPSLLA